MAESQDWAHQYEDNQYLIAGQQAQEVIVPSTPFLHKYKTELCKNWENQGSCIFGDQCSFAHGLQQLHTKIDLPSKYKTRLCKKYQEELYCPYGVRCQFIHSERKTSDVSNESEFMKKQIFQPTPLDPKLPLYSDILSDNLKLTVENYIAQREVYGNQTQIHYINQYKSKRLACFQQMTTSPTQGINEMIPQMSSTQYSMNRDKNELVAQLTQKLNKLTNENVDSQNIGRLEVNSTYMRSFITPKTSTQEYGQYQVNQGFLNKGDTMNRNLNYQAFQQNMNQDSPMFSQGQQANHQIIYSQRKVSGFNQEYYGLVSPLYLPQVQQTVTFKPVQAFNYHQLQPQQ
eukprot:403355299